MATKNATMSLSTSQAQAIAKAEGVKFPRKDNSWVKLGDAVTLKRLPKAFRKKGRNAEAYRLTAPNHADLERFFGIAEANGRTAVIVYRTEE